MEPLANIKTNKVNLSGQTVLFDIFVNLFSFFVLALNFINNKKGAVILFHLQRSLSIYKSTIHLMNYSLIVNLEIPAFSSILISFCTLISDCPFLVAARSAEPTVYNSWDRFASASALKRATTDLTLTI